MMSMFSFRLINHSGRVVFVLYKATSKPAWLVIIVINYIWWNALLTIFCSECFVFNEKHYWIKHELHTGTQNIWIHCTPVHLSDTENVNVIKLTTIQNGNDSKWTWLRVIHKTQPIVNNKVKMVQNKKNRSRKNH